MRIAYRVHQFPAISQTFILNEMVGLLERGHAVEVWPNSGQVEGKVHEDVAKYGLLDKTVTLGMPKGRASRIAKAATVAFREVIAGRWRSLGTLNVARYGREAASLRLFYTAQRMASCRPYDIVSCQFGPSGLWATRLRQSGAISSKIVTTFHGYDVSSYVSARGRAVYKSLFEHGDLFIAVSDAMAGRLSDLGCPDAKLLCLPLGINLRRFQFRPRSLSESELVRIVSVGRLVEKKGYETSLRAFARVAENHPGARYNIVGEGPLRGELEALIDSLSLRGRVELLGEMTENEVVAEYERSHLCLLPSQTGRNGDEEGMPLVAKEAQAMGLPILSTRHGSIPEAVIDGKTGFLVGERDEIAMADRLDYLLAHSTGWTAMGTAGRAFVESRFDGEKRSDRLAEVYQGLLRQDAQPASEVLGQRAR